jgi:hypothetical protein
MRATLSTAGAQQLARIIDLLQPKRSGIENCAGDGGVMIDLQFRSNTGPAATVTEGLACGDVSVSVPEPVRQLQDDRGLFDTVLKDMGTSTSQL